MTGSAWVAIASLLVALLAVPMASAENTDRLRPMLNLPVDPHRPVVCSDGDRGFRLWPARPYERLNPTQIPFPSDDLYGGCAIQFVFTTDDDVILEGTLLANATFGCSGIGSIDEARMTVTIGDSVTLADPQEVDPAISCPGSRLLRFSVGISEHKVPGQTPIGVAFSLPWIAVATATKPYLGIAHNGDDGNITIPGINATWYPAPLSIGLWQEEDRMKGEGIPMSTAAMLLASVSVGFVLNRGRSKHR